MKALRMRKRDVPDHVLKERQHTLVVCSECKEICVSAGNADSELLVYKGVQYVCFRCWNATEWMMENAMAALDPT